MKTKVNAYLMTLDKKEREFLLQPENKWMLIDRIWDEATRQADKVAVEDKYESS